jgi:TRAP-type C4-dicarboxylate transport system substrate-binding protein
LGIEQQEEFIMKRKAVFVLVAAAAFFSVMPVYGQKRPQGTVVVKLASMVPENSEWGRMISTMSAEWSKATNGEVQLQVFANGTQGSEEEVLRKLNMNTIQAAVLTSLGLTKIAPEILTLSCPFLIRNEAELNEVLKNIGPDFEARINSQNYFTLVLAKAGWIKIFSRNPVFVPTDLKRQKLGSSPSEPEMAHAFRSMGYQVVEVDLSRLLIALNGGTIDAIYQSPIFTAASQFFGVAKNMASINIAPFMGGVVMNKHAWESIPAQHREKLIGVTRRSGIELEASLLKLEADTIRLMKNNGLKENTVSPAQQQEWYNDITRVVPGLLGTTFDRATYGKIENILKTYRSRQ